jgi:hypothetical protein
VASAFGGAPNSASQTIPAAHPDYVVEQALAHTIGNAVEAAYWRGDLFAKRVALMDDWAAYLARPAAQVVPLRPRDDPGRAVALKDHVKGSAGLVTRFKHP